MRFSQKLTLLICGCVLVLAALCMIQYRLVNNTYQLEQAAYFQQVKERLQPGSQSVSDSLNNHAMKLLLSTVQQQIENGISPDLTNFQQQIDQHMHIYNRSIAKIILRDSLLRHIGYGMEYTLVVLYHGKQIDTLLRPAAKPLLLFGKEKGIFSIGGGKQEVGFLVKARLGNVEHSSIYRLEVWNKSTIVASDWQTIVLKRMAATLIGSVVLIMAVMSMFFLIFMALLKQKKIVEVTTDFANNMTHELKTPLSVAAVVIKSLRTPDAKLDEEWFSELLAQLDRQHGKIGRLIDSVLTSALDRPVGVAQLRPFKLMILLDELKILVAAAERELLLAGKTDVIIFTDPDLLTGILSNLVDNALKYTPPDSPLWLTTITSNSTITISLEDMGPGIAGKYQPYLFQKFFRVPKTGTAQTKGLGLGLYLCNIQAQQLKGTLTYERNSSGGSIFNLILPYEKDAGITR